jgi:ComF family protein
VPVLEYCVIMILRSTIPPLDDSAMCCVRQRGGVFERQMFRVGSRILDLLLPPHCACCGTETQTAGLFCSDCFSTLQSIGSPSCRRCGTGFASSSFGGQKGICAACEATPPPWDEARAAYVYDEQSRRLILPLKYSNRTENASVLARAMARAGHDMLLRADIVAPVPLHRSRLWRRRYNQAALIAAALRQSRDFTLLPDLLERTRRTPKLARLNQAERLRVMSGVVAVRSRYASRVRGARIVLVDDVLTTGATLGACASALRSAGAASIGVLVAARTAAPANEGWETPPFPGLYDEGAQAVSGARD